MSIAKQRKKKTLLEHEKHNYNSNIEFNSIGYTHRLFMFWKMPKYCHKITFQNNARSQTLTFSKIECLVWLIFLCYYSKIQYFKETKEIKRKLCLFTCFIDVLLTGSSFISISSFSSCIKRTVITALSSRIIVFIITHKKNK